MKKIILGIAILLIATTVIFAQSNKTGRTKKAAVSGVIYTCPMHKEIRRNKPGKCPKCGMKLVAIKKQNPKKNRRSRKANS
jgi:heavy metal-binding protein